jgi:hypothetical protein
LNSEIPPEPRWHPCYYAPGEPMSGEILVSFAVAETDYNFMASPKDTDLTKMVEFKEFNVDMLILGLREL